MFVFIRFIVTYFYSTVLYSIAKIPAMIVVFDQIDFLKLTGLFIFKPFPQIFSYPHCFLTQYKHYCKTHRSSCSLSCFFVKGKFLMLNLDASCNCYFNDSHNFDLTLISSRFCAHRKKLYVTSLPTV